MATSMATVVKVCSSHDFNKILEFGQLVAEIEESDEIQFDFSEVTFTSPSWLLVVSQIIEATKLRSPNIRRVAQNYRHLSYASHMGFFRKLGLNFGRSPGEARGSGTYAPICVRKTSEIVESSAERLEHHGDYLEREAANLANIVTQGASGALFDTLVYSLREILRNVIEHSEAEELSYVAQYWPSQNIAEIAVSDNGIGITRSLRRHPKLRNVQPREALRLAKKPGVSGKGALTRSPHDVWANSGYGLFMTTELAKRTGGDFFLASDGLALVNDSEQSLSPKLLGTYVGIRFATSSLTSLSSSLSKLRDEGSKIAKSLDIGAISEASASSIGLSKSEE